MTTEESAKKAFESQSDGWGGAPTWENLAEESKVFWRDYVMSRDNHPWAKFLEARMEVIRWMDNEGQSVIQIMDQLSKEKTVSNFEALKKQLESDHAYAWSWHCNLAVPIMDEGETHAFANNCASRIMVNLFGVDTSAFPEFQPPHSVVVPTNLSDYELGTTLEAFCREQHALVEAFKKHWQEESVKNPDQYPLWLPESNAGEWDEQFAAFNAPS